MKKEVKRCKHTLLISQTMFPLKYFVCGTMSTLWVLLAPFHSYCIPGTLFGGAGTTRGWKDRKFKVKLYGDDISKKISHYQQQLLKFLHTQNYLKSLSFLHLIFCRRNLLSNFAEVRMASWLRLSKSSLQRSVALVWPKYIINVCEFTLSIVPNIVLQVAASLAEVWASWKWHTV